MPQTPEELLARLTAVEAELAVVKVENAWLKRKLYGPGQSEKTDRLQSNLPLEETPAAPAPAAVQKVSYDRVAGPREARALPAETFKNVPVRERLILVPTDVHADPDSFELIAEETTFEIDIVAPQIFKREIVRRKYRHKTDRQRPPLMAPAPQRPVMGGYASAGLLAWIAHSKYVDHVPLYRLEKQSARWGAEISRQSMADWVRIAAEWLEPIYRKMLQRLLAGSYLQVDETPVRCNDPDHEQGGTTEGWLWVVSRPGDDVVFDWRLSRRHGELTSLIEGYSGVLQSDAYGAYESYVRNHPEVAWVGCWAHARRKFFDAQAENPRAIDLVLRLIGWLYECEATYDENKLTSSNRRRHRQKHYPRKLYWLKKIVLGLRERALPKSGLGKACNYLLKYWEPLTAHLKYGHTRIDNNLIENAIRPSAIGKKNWLFIGHPDAGHRSAIIYSIVVSCQRHGKDPLAYLRDVLARIPKMTTKDDLDQLTPINWKPA